VPQIDAVDAGERFAGAVVILGVDEVVATRSSVSRGSGWRRGRGPWPRAPSRPGPRRRRAPAVVGAGSSGARAALHESLGRNGVVVLLQGQVAGGQVGLQAVGLLLEDRVVVAFKHLPSIGAAQEGASAYGNSIFGALVPPRLPLRQDATSSSSSAAASALPLRRRTSRPRRRRRTLSGNRVSRPQASRTPRRSRPSPGGPGSRGATTPPRREASPCPGQQPAGTLRTPGVVEVQDVVDGELGWERERDHEAAASKNVADLKDISSHRPALAGCLALILRSPAVHGNVWRCCGGDGGSMVQCPAD